MPPERMMSEDEMAKQMRTPSGAPSAAARQKTGLRDESGKPTGRFPIFDRESAVSALKLRGKAKNKRERMSIIQRARKFAPKEAEAAMQADKDAGML